MPHRKILSKIKDKGYRLTRQRMIILEELAASKEHPNAEQIYQAVKKKVKNVSFGTVYRNLKILRELGLIMEMNFAKGCSRYDINAINHQHFVCSDCGRVYDVDIPVTINVNNVMINRCHAQVDDFRLEFYGICPECKTSS